MSSAAISNRRDLFARRGRIGSFVVTTTDTFIHGRVCDANLVCKTSTQAVTDPLGPVAGITLLPLVLVVSACNIK
jgi:hypothetical protein